MSSKLYSIVNRVNTTAPTFLRGPLLSLIFNTNIKYAGTTGIRVQEWNETHVIVNLKNHLRVQNHLKTIHATAMATLAESTSGMMFGTYLRDTTHLPLLKSMNIKFVKLAKGNLQAKATITSEQIQDMQTLDKGSTIIDVTVTDEESKQPIICEMEWAWTPMKKKKK